MTELYDYLEEIMPVKRVLIALAIGMISLFIVLISGLTSDFVRSETIASRAFSAFSYTTLISFILMMFGEEYAIFKTDKELEHFIDDAFLEETLEDFDREEYLYEYLHGDEEENSDDAEAENNFQPMDVISNQS
ncbi:MAG: hypothetical protein IKT98_12165 [Selenomonadaceae bacterium]|nr:hypothetical protein [Selenomonadaceae bacterium]